MVGRGDSQQKKTIWGGLADQEDKYLEHFPSPHRVCEEVRVQWEGILKSEYIRPVNHTHSHPTSCHKTVLLKQGVGVQVSLVNGIRIFHSSLMGGGDKFPYFLQLASWIVIWQGHIWKVTVICGHWDKPETPTKEPQGAAWGNHQIWVNSVRCFCN